MVSNLFGRRTYIPKHFCHSFSHQPSTPKMLNTLMKPNQALCRIRIGAQTPSSECKEIDGASEPVAISMQPSSALFTADGAPKHPPVKLLQWIKSISNMFFLREELVWTLPMAPRILACWCPAFAKETLAACGKGMFHS